MSKYATSENFNADGSQISKLEPSIYKGKVTKVEKGTKQDFNTKEDLTSIDIYFIDSVTGNIHVDQSTDVTDDKAQSQFERLLHIASRCVTEEEFQKFQKLNFEEFEDLADEYVKLMKDSNEVDVEFKVVGSTYGGKASTKIPSFSSKYPVPFIERIGGGKQLKFNNNEIAENTAYKKLISGNTDGGEAPAANQASLFM